MQSAKLRLKQLTSNPRRPRLLTVMWDERNTLDNIGTGIVDVDIGKFLDSVK